MSPTSKMIYYLLFRIPVYKWLDVAIKMHPRVLRMFIKPLLLLFLLGGLSIMFYYALLDALKKHKDPISDSFRKRSKEDIALERVYEKSAKWMALSKRNKLKNLRQNPVFAPFDIEKPEKKKYVNVLIIVSSGPRRVDRRNAIRETWWKDCKNTNGVSEYLIYMSILPSSDKIKYLLN